MVQLCCSVLELNCNMHSVKSNLSYRVAICVEQMLSENVKARYIGEAHTCPLCLSQTESRAKPTVLGRGE